ncbi:MULTISPECIES: YadA-like family protein [Enterobacterales]|uniref:YadA-like family protein n=1 Tax=Enterobacterales TaxID=91347 RepID=UPI002EDA471A
MINPNTVNMGAGGSTKLNITNTGLISLATLTMSNNKILSLAPGTNPTDAVNYSQLTDLSQTGTLYFHANSTLADSTPTGTNSIAIGPVANAVGNNSVTLGSYTSANGTGSIAIGGGDGTATNPGAQTQGSEAISIGLGSVATGNGNVSYGSTTAIGTRSKAFTYSTAIGSNAIAGTNTNNNAATAVGVNSNASGDRASAVGASSQATGNYSSAYGTLANASGDRSTATGVSSQATGSFSSAYGTLANAAGANSTAIGTSASAAATNTVALGNGAVASTAGSVALGSGSTTAAANPFAGSTINGTAYTYAGGTPASVVSVGSAGAERQVTNVAAGRLSATSTDAVNGSQLFATNSAVTSLGTTVNNINNGSGIKYFHTNSTLADSAAGGTNSVAIGPVASSTATNAVALGNGATASTAGSVALGSGSTTAAANPFASSAINGTAYTYAGGTPASVVSVGSAGAERQVTNVAAGRLSATSTDAVNGSQLFATNSAVTSLGTTVNNINNGSGIKYFHANSTLADSAAGGTNSVAIGPVASSTAANAVALGNGATASTAGSVALGSGSTTAAATAVTGSTINGTAYTYAGGAPASVVSVGSAGAERQVTNVAAGRLSATSTDAVNGSQLFATNSSVTSLGTTVNNIVNNGSGIKYFHTNSTLADSTVTGTDSVAIGPVASSTATNAVALGNGAVASTAGSVALGSGSTTAAANPFASSAINGTTYTYAGGTPASVVSVGSSGAERQVTNVAAGRLSATSTDAVNGSQLFATNTSINSLGTTVNNIVNNGSGIKYFHTNSTLADSTVTGTDSVAIGPVASSTAANAVALGNGATASTAGSVALGSGSTTAAATAVTGSTINGTAYTYAGGAPASVVSVGSAGAERQVTNVAAGRLSATSTDAVNGSQLFATNSSVTSLGTTVNNIVNNGSGIKYFHTNSTLADSAAGGTNSVAIGPVASSTATNAVALGNGATASTAGSVALGSGSTTAAANPFASSAINGTAYTYAGGTPASVVSVGSAGAERQVTNVAAGRLSATSTDAVNGSQLFATNSELANVGSTVNNIVNNGSGIKYFHTNSTLADSTAGGTNSVAIGPVASSTAANTVALGNGATASTAGSVALGSGSTTAAANPFASSSINGTTYTYAGGAPTSVISVGRAGAERQVTNVAAGRLSATSTDAVNGSQLFATNSELANVGSTVNNIVNNGSGIKYFHTNSTLADSTAGGTNSVAVGPAASATATNGIAIGNGAVASIADSVALGSGSTTAAANPFASSSINGTTYTYAGGAPTSVISVGRAGAERQVTNVAAGRLSATSTDAVNGSQLFATNSELANVGSTVNNIVNNGSGIKYFHTNSTLADSSASGTDSVAVGPAASATATNGIAIGNGAVASIADSVALGSGSTTAAANPFASSAINGTAYTYAGGAPTSVISVGRAGAERQVTNVAAGRLSATSTDAVNGSQLFATNTEVTNLGIAMRTITTGGGIKYFHTNSTAADSVASGANAIAVGPQAKASGEGAIAMGDGATASATNSVALGSQSSDGGRGAETYTGKYSGALNNSAGTVSIGNAQTNTTRTLSNVADGKNATDAVNLRQLDGAVEQANRYTDTTVNNISGDIAETKNNVTNLMGGKAGMFQVNNTSKRASPQPVGENATAGGAGARATGKNSTALGTNAAASAENSVALGANSVADRSNSVSVGSLGEERQITNVAAGTRNTDAVNYSQLKNSVDNSRAYTDNQVADLRGELYKQDDVLSAGVASAMAMANQPQPTSPGGSMVTLASGSYRSEAAIALGFSKVSDNGRWVTKMQASTNTQGDAGVGVGIGLQW